MFAATMAIAIVAAVANQLVPIHRIGAVSAMLLAAVACAAVWFVSREPATTSATLADADLPLLSQRAEEWLERQRPALPASATRLVDDIARKLQDLPAQLVGLDSRAPVADEIRKLLSRELPNLIEGYRSVPGSLRRNARNGMADADTQLVEGLGVIDGQIARLTEQLGSGAFDTLATNNRYLATKYRGDDDLRG